MAFILGLTGNIASGKTTIGLLLLELGAHTYCDADMVVHELYLPGQPLALEVGQAFGPSVLDADGGVDRKALGAIVFGDREKLQALERMVHPHVRAELVRRLHAVPDDSVGVLDAIKLLESGYAPFCHAIWVVTCPLDVQLRRLVEQRGLSEDEARARLAAQPPLAPKLEMATEVINNSGSLDDLRQQVTAAWHRFQATLA